MPQLQVFVVFPSSCIASANFLYEQYSHTVRLDSILQNQACAATPNHQLQLVSACSHFQQQPILLLKMDTEGYEQSVLEGLSSLLESRQVANPCHIFYYNRFVISLLFPQESHGSSNIIIFAGAEHHRRTQSAQPC